MKGSFKTVESVFTMMVEKTHRLVCPHCEYEEIRQDNIRVMRIDRYTSVYACPQCRKPLPVASY